MPAFADMTRKTGITRVKRNLEEKHIGSEIHERRLLVILSLSLEVPFSEW
jgi:hypothetical protein